MVGQKYGGLPGRISSAADDYGIVSAEAGLDVGGSIIDADAFKLREIGQVRLAVLSSRGDDHGAALHHFSIVGVDRIGLGLALQVFGRPRDRDFGAELFGLHKCPARQVLARYAGWKSEIVFNA